MTLYNDNDPFCAAWLRELIAAGHLPAGDVLAAPIESLTHEHLSSATAFHAFAGIGGWPLALQLAGWPADRPVWTGSCPCQPFSAAGKRLGAADKRHLWPAWFALIRQCRPDTIFGEQVASAIGHGWLDGISADLEAEGYAVGAVVLGAHSVGAPHIRQRLYWVAQSQCAAGESRRAPGRPAEGAGADGAGAPDQPGRSSNAGSGLAHYERPRLEERAGEPGDARAQREALERGGDAVGVGHPERDGAQRAGTRQYLAHATGPWSDATLHKCLDNKTRRIPLEPDVQLVVDGLPIKLGPSGFTREEIQAITSRFPLSGAVRNRVGILRGAGNSIVPAVAATFIKACMESWQCLALPHETAQ